MRMNGKHPAAVTRPQTLIYFFLNPGKSKTHLKFMKLGMLLWSGINMPWKFFVPFGAGLGISFSQIRAFHNKLDGFCRERPTFGDEMIPIACYWFQKNSRVNVEQQECSVIFSDFSGFVWTFLCIKWVFNAFMCIIQIWTTCTCSSAYKLVENQIVVLGCMLRSHARNGNEFQTPGHRWLPAKHWATWLLKF